ncbi:patatin-like phospholipase family protein [Fimbriiglobus ruber]|uniref:Putative lipoprotein n=1 Tax=Fimbriiglobus ruber TaxID=1908690 RepID=A0A225DR33_9BACT|nr:patatin-like phospholipase family protein [Fimbriiglobus ruber]OWK41078.1 putative lipoprotein [Fimbriiglobus ruber]
MRTYRFQYPLASCAGPAALAGLLAILAGCSSTPKRAEPLPPEYKAKKITDLAAPAGTYQPVERVTADALASALAAPVAPQDVAKKDPDVVIPKGQSRPLNILALSGGGQYGAYAQGILCGWTESGKRPDFDVVTGISSGALIAVFAYLGPKYDPNMQRLATSLKTSDVFTYRPLISILWHNSIATAAPLEKLIAAEVNDETLADIRAAHLAGRKLYVGTMLQRTRRLVVWDLGAIACSGRPDADTLVRKVLLATSSIPGLVPSVDFDVDVNGVRYKEEHADGGAVAQTFIKFGPGTPEPNPATPGVKWLAGSNLYIIAGGKLYVDPIEGRLGFLTRATSTISATLYALYRADLWRLYTLCAVSGMKFHHAFVPEDTPIAPKSTTFDLKTMRLLFTLGHDLAKCGEVWRTTPPGYEVGEEEYPRAGFQFTIP